jgi:dihydrolipoamide dehydrogenase
MAIALEATVSELAHSVHAHPTLPEAIMEAARAWLGRGIHA